MYTNILVTNIGVLLILIFRVLPWTKEQIWGYSSETQMLWLLALYLIHLTTLPLWKWCILFVFEENPENIYIHFPIHPATIASVCMTPKDSG